MSEEEAARSFAEYVKRRLREDMAKRLDEAIRDDLTPGWRDETVAVVPWEGQ